MKSKETEVTVAEEMVAVEIETEALVGTDKEEDLLILPIHLPMGTDATLLQAVRVRAEVEVVDPMTVLVKDNVGNIKFQ